MKATNEGPVTNLRGLLARQKIEGATKSAARVRQKLHEESEVNRLAYERFLNTLTLVAGGTFALSLTYLGYLKTAGGQPTHLWVLKASWVLLLCCLAGSIFYRSFHTRYTSRARMREYAEKLVAQRRANIEEVDHLDTLDEEGKHWNREELKQTLTAEMNKFQVDADYNRKRENFYAWLYPWDDRVTQCTFLLGLALLLAFAFLNT